MHVSARQSRVLTGKRLARRAGASNRRAARTTSKQAQGVQDIFNGKGDNRGITERNRFQNGRGYEKDSNLPSGNRDGPLTCDKVKFQKNGLLEPLQLQRFRGAKMLSRDDKPSTIITNKINTTLDKKAENEVQFPDKERSDESLKWRHLYKLARYRRKRRAFLASHPYCAICGDVAEDLDHIIPHEGDMRLFWNPKNWQALCHRCHSRKTRREVNERIRERRNLYGGEKEN